MTGLFVEEKNVSRLYRQRGASVIKALVLIPVALVLLLVLVFAFYEGRKAYWDYRVREMCEKDGGVDIIESITLSKEQAAVLPRANGFIGVAPESLAKPEEPVFSRIQRQRIKDGDPSIIRYQQDIVRRSDGHVIAIAVTYVRAGGDIPSFAYPSHFYCPELGRLYANIGRVFQIEEMPK